LLAEEVDELLADLVRGRHGPVSTGLAARRALPGTRHENRRKVQGVSARRGVRGRAGGLPGKPRLPIWPAFLRWVSFSEFPPDIPLDPERDMARQRDYDDEYDAGYDDEYEGGGSRGAPPPNYLVPSILVTLCCCLIGGIIAIVHAAQVNSKWAAGDY